jgi:hypothetical protein
MHTTKNVASLISAEQFLYQTKCGPQMCLFYEICEKGGSRVVLNAAVMHAELLR